MKGKVIKRSENLLADAARKAGTPITAGPWALVEFENGFRLVVDSQASVEKPGRSRGCQELATFLDSLLRKRNLRVL